MDLHTLTLRRLQGLGLAELEQLYGRPGEVALPAGCFAGHHLRWLRTPGARHPLWRPAEALLFQRTPFGVDFARRRWFFWRRELGLGRFTPSAGPSRWRDTDTIRLDYEVSRLPGPLRGLLYDEVRPLSGTLCLGLGGINAPRGRGDHFFFALQRIG